MNAAAPLVWRRTSDGLEAEHPLTGGVYALQRHHVDDRVLDGGHVHTYWNVLIDGCPVEQYGSWRIARHFAEESARIRLRREAHDGRVFVRSAPLGQLRGRCELVTVDPDTLEERVIGVEPTRQGAELRATSIGPCNLQCSGL